MRYSCDLQRHTYVRITFAHAYICACNIHIKFARAEIIPHSGHFCTKQLPRATWSTITPMPYLMCFSLRHPRYSLFINPYISPFNSLNVLFTCLYSNFCMLCSIYDIHASRVLLCPNKYGSRESSSVHVQAQGGECNSSCISFVIEHVPRRQLPDPSVNFL